MLAQEKIGRVLEIYYCSQNGGDVKPGGVRNPMIAVETITAQEDMGLVANGVYDRYHKKARHGFWDAVDEKRGEEKLRQVSLVSHGALERFGQRGVMSRRNLILDVDPELLLELLRQRAILAFGLQALLRLERDCDACNRPSRLDSGSEDFKHLGVYGGARARIIRGGDVTLDDIVAVHNSR